ncbi:UNVERIFIED_CONTAM: hypothetical protein GTU68_006651, partial [Idotea baltica]|nr:hypothetical protein [Idotea baltica]
VNSNIPSLPTYNVGLSEDVVKQKYGLTDIVKLASNENPYGPSATVRIAIEHSLDKINIYPDATASELRQLLSDKLQVDADSIIVGNGSEELISIAARTFLNAADEMTTVSPDFGLHAIHTMSMGACVRYIKFNDDFSFNVEGIIDALKKKPKMLCISSPSNPVGSFLREQDIKSIARACGDHTVFVFDEAYYEYASTESDYPDCISILRDSGARFILLRTFSKAYGLAGIRIGYGIANHKDVIEHMHRVRMPFNVNTIAQIAAASALNDSSHMNHCCKVAARDREVVFQALSKMGLKIAPSTTNFLFVNTNHSANQIAEALQSRGVIVKPWSSPGYDTFIRISIGTPAEIEYFLASIEDVLSEV